jgi:hypothetical protein
MFDGDLKNFNHKVIEIKSKMKSDQESKIIVPCEQTESLLELCIVSLNFSLKYFIIFLNFLSLYRKVT